MRDRVTQIKRAIALMLAILMVITGLPQTAYTVYGAEPDSGEIDLTLEPEAAESEIAEPEVNDAAIVEEEEIVYEGEELEIEETESAIESEMAESEETDVEETEIAELEVEGDDPVVIFDANGGTMPTLDDNAIGSTGEEGAWLTQTFAYWERDDGTLIYSIRSLDDIKPVRENYKFIGWFDENGNTTSPVTGEARTFKAKWARNLGDAPSLDSNYGENGLKLFTAGNKVRFSMKVNKSDYADILNSLDEEKEVLRIYYQYAAQKPVHGGSSTPDADGYYYRWNTQLINKDDDYTEFPGEAFDAYDYDYLFDGIPTEAVSVRFRLAYVIVEKDDEGSWIKWDDWRNVVGESEYINNYSTYAPAVTSVALKDINVLKPVKFGPELTSEITLNKGADINNLSIKYVYDGEPHDSKPDFLDKLEISDGKLKVKAADNAQAGKSVDIIFYNKKMYDAHGNLVPWDQQKITGNKYTITVQNPTWISKTPTATLTSASDVALTFKVGAPSGESFADGNYYVGVGLTTNNNTAKGLKEGLVINDAYEEFFKINEDGTIPEITINPFRVGNVDGTKVTKLGDGCGTSMNAIFYIVMTDGNAPDNGGKPLATTDEKKCKTITAATKAPYYADKITLKKVNTNLYAGDEKVVATVDFGKNATYTTKDCWKIANTTELEENGISAEQDGDNKVKVSVGDGVPAGKYTINAETVAESEMGVPAKASITVTVLPTARNVTADPVTIYRKPKSKVSYKVTSTVTDQGGAVNKNAAYTYEIGSGDASPLETVSGLTVNKGTINVDKSVPAGEYRLKITAKCGREVSSELIPVKIVEDKIDLAEFVFSNPGGATIADEMTLAKYNDLGWDKSYIADASAVMSINDIAGSGLQLRDSNNVVVTWNLIKSVKIPNPKFINKAGKITLSAEAIDGTKLSRTINIVPNTTSSAENFSKLHLKGSADSEYVMENGAFDVSGESTGTVYSLWLSELDDDTVNSLTDISGNKLTLKGAKIINNYHNDYLTFTMTGMTTTITLSVGKSKGTYTIINDTFAKTPPKKITAENKKIYTNFTDDAGKQYIYYNFSSAIEGVASFRLQTTNKTLLPLIDSIDADHVGDESLKLTISPKVSRDLKAGSYTIAVEPLDGSGNALCKPFNITLKLENLKKSFKYKNSYTMSYKDATAVPLEVTSYAGLSSSGAAPVLLDDNIKGQYNKITDILEINGAGNIRLKDGKKYADKVTSMTGYIKYTVYWLDGTKEDRLEKITVKMSDKPVLKLRTPDFVRYYYEAGMEDPYSDLPVFDSKTYTWVKIAKVAVFDSKTEELLKEGTVKLQADGKLKFTVKPKGTGKVTLKLNVIPETSIYKNEEITKNNSVTVTVTINYKKW